MFTKKRGGTKAVGQFVRVHGIGLVLSQPNPDRECIGQSSIIHSCDKIQASHASTVTDYTYCLWKKKETAYNGRKIFSSVFSMPSLQ